MLALISVLMDKDLEEQFEALSRFLSTRGQWLSASLRSRVCGIIFSFESEGITYT
jgi:hypothetical protein